MLEVFQRNLYNFFSYNEVLGSRPDKELDLSQPSTVH